MNLKSLRLISIAIVFFASSSSAEIAAWYANVDSILVDDKNYGGCMIAVTPDPSSQTDGACTTNWISLNCKALDPTDYGYDADAAGYTIPKKSDGAAKLGAAQLAFVTDTQLYIVVNTGVKFNSRCVAIRAQNTKRPLAQ